jgi:hypothetical protein
MSKSQQTPKIPLPCPGPANLYAPFGWADLPIPPPRKGYKESLDQDKDLWLGAESGLSTHCYLSGFQLESFYGSPRKSRCAVCGIGTQI